MPWKEANVVELRKEFVLEALEADLPFTALCRKYGISSKTGYKWKERFVEQGTAGVSDQSRRPVRSLAQLTEQNGGHERMHSDIALEVEGRIDGGFVEQQAALEVWRREFNYQRPHEALGMRTPAEVYTKSKRSFDPKPITLSYPQEYLQRRVKRNGAIKLSNREIKVSTTVAGWDVGLKLVGDQHYRLWFGQLCLGDIHLGDEIFSAISEAT